MKTTVIYVTLASLLLALTGCASTNSTPAPAAPIVLDSNAVYRAVCIGLTNVDPVKYDGWDGECPGCDVDAKSLTQYFASGGIATTLLLNKECTIKGVKAAIAANAASLRAGDVLILTTSGHGGQVQDRNGDETDGLDETVCLWDGQWVDDDIMTFLTSLPVGIHIFLITDNCHAEGNFRAFIRATTRMVSFGKYGKQPTLRLKAKAAKEASLSLVQFAGCREASYSYSIDAVQGGTWTQALLANKSATWNAWFFAAANKMPKRQTPVLVKCGDVETALNMSVLPQGQRTTIKR